MIQLSTRGVARGLGEDIIGRVSLAPVPTSERGDTIRVFQAPGISESLDGYLAAVAPDNRLERADALPVVSRCDVNHLDSGDVISISPEGYVRTVYRLRSKNNTLFATDRCNSLCLMCSQPPREVDDTRNAKQLVRIVSLIDSSTEALGITGGEPTLLGQGLLDVVTACRDRLPKTSLHILSNGRRFYYSRFARALGDIRHPDLMVGVPVYSDIDAHHDYIVQAKRSFEETIIGLHNLANEGVHTEVRIVIHRETFRRLPQLADYIYRNLTFASHVAFMGLEVIGFAKANIQTLWMDPLDYADDLEAAVLMLATVGMNVSIYNHQLCTLPRSLWSFHRSSISDWKAEFSTECTDCAVKEQCGGFFAWNLNGYQSRGIRRLRE